MAFSDWVGDGAVTVSQVAGPGTSKAVKVDKSSGLLPADYIKPSGTTVNGQTVTGFDKGQIVTQFQVNTTNLSNAGCFAGVRFRHVDGTHYYIVRFGITASPGSLSEYAISYLNGGAETFIVNYATTSNVTIAGNTWYYARVSWWSEGNKVWIRLELSTDGITWYQQGNDVNDGGANVSSAGELIVLTVSAIENVSQEIYTLYANTTIAKA